MAFGDRPKQAKDYSVVVKDVLLAATIHLSPDHLSAFSLLLSQVCFSFFNFYIEYDLS